MTFNFERRNGAVPPKGFTRAMRIPKDLSRLSAPRQRLDELACDTEAEVEEYDRRPGEVRDEFPAYQALRKTEDTSCS